MNLHVRPRVRKPPFVKTTTSNAKPRYILQKFRLDRYFEFLSTIMGLPLWKNANFSTMLK